MIMACSAAFSQAFIGARFGINLAYWHSNNSDTTLIGYKNSPTLGITAGIPLSIPLSLDGQWTMELTPSYTQYGSKTSYSILFNFSPDSIVTDIKTTGHLNYIELPIMFKYSFTDRGFMPYIGAGPTFGIGLSGTSTATVTVNDYTMSPYTSNDTDLTTSTSTTSDVSFDTTGFSRFNFGVMIGVGAMYQTPKYGIDFNLTYVMGISNLYGSSHTVLTNNGIMITLDYLFNLSYY